LDTKTKKELEKTDDIKKTIEKVGNDKIIKLNVDGDKIILNRLSLQNGVVIPKQIAEIIDEYDSLKNIEKQIDETSDETEKNIKITERNERMKQIVKKVNNMYAKKEKARLANPKAIIKTLRKLTV
jgi:hypothetical protein